MLCCPASFASGQCWAFLFFRVAFLFSFFSPPLPLRLLFASQYRWLVFPLRHREDFFPHTERWTSFTLGVSNVRLSRSFTCARTLIVDRRIRIGFGSFDPSASSFGYVGRGVWESEWTCFVSHVFPLQDTGWYRELVQGFSYYLWFNAAYFIQVFLLFIYLVVIGVPVHNLRFLLFSIFIFIALLLGYFSPNMDELTELIDSLDSVNSQINN